MGIIPTILLFITGISPPETQYPTTSPQILVQSPLGTNVDSYGSSALYGVVTIVGTLSKNTSIHS